MPNESTILTHRQNRRPLFAPRQVLLSGDERYAQCSNCGSDSDLKVVVEPRREHGDARITYLVCTNCVRTVRVEDGMVGGSRTEIGR